jgi:hypothetical protein
VDRRRLLGTAAAAATLAAPSLVRGAGLRFAQTEQRAAVDLALVLAADVSRSIDDEEFALQRRGYADAVLDKEFIDGVAAGPRGAIALTYVEWAGDGEQSVLVDWALVRNRGDAQRFVDTMSATRRAFVGRTAIGTAIDFSFALFAETAFETDRRVIDVSGDGTSNQGRIVTEARDAAVKGGAVINGLAIFNKKAAASGGYMALHTNPPGGLAKYYTDNVIGGPGAFVVQIDDFATFGDAMRRKLLKEVANARSGGGSSANERSL